MSAQPQGWHTCERVFTVVGLSQEPQGETLAELETGLEKSEPDLSLQEAEA